ncbi:MAG: hypothetical protein AAF657_20785 [Acidobacteriota bacterium]
MSFRFDGCRRFECRAGRPFVGSVLLLSTLLLSTVGCVSTTGGLFTRPESSPEQPWQVPADAYPSQRLYRVKYQGPEGEAGFKLTLYLEQATRYRMLATDLGRKLWSLEVDPEGQATWIDYRRKEFCRADAAGALRFVPLAELPVVAMPKLLLGLMPAEPAASLEQSIDRVAFLDARGQLWNGGLAGNQVDWWSLIESGEPVIWWRREGDGGLFVDRDGQQQIRWSQIVHEPLAKPLAVTSPPAKFRPDACREAPAR